MQVIFEGKVSFQSVAGQTVTVNVTKPDGTIDVFTTLTKEDKTFASDKRTYGAGNYTVQTSIGADEEYLPAQSPVEPFTLTLQDRTITVTVTIAPP